MKRLFCVVIGVSFVFLTACGEAPSTMTASAPSPDSPGQKQKKKQNKETLEKYSELIEFAYIDTALEKGQFAKCESAQWQDRMFYECGAHGGFSAPDGQLGDMWELVVENDEPTYYAMNGKALRTMERFRGSAEFKSGAGERPLAKIEELRNAIER